MPQRFSQITRRSEKFESDDKRVIPRYLNFQHGPRIRSVFRRLLKLPERCVGERLAEVMSSFASRHRDIREAFAWSYEQAARHVRKLPELSARRRLLIGAYFTMEYSIESAALFNPSIVPHPDQTGLEPGQTRFLMSLRATGEGHLSSIVFRRGVFGPGTAMTMDPPPRFAWQARPEPDPTMDKGLFVRKLRDMGEGDAYTRQVLDCLDDAFTLHQLKSALASLKQPHGKDRVFRQVRDEMLWLATANYTLQFPEDCLPAENVIFPATEFEQRGMEDLRLVRFVEDDGSVCYYGTYTAFDGKRICPMFLETRDFHRFHIGTLSGRYVRNKGMALFPRRIDGYYLMLSRHDGENNHLMWSRNLYVWNTSEKLQTPKEPWELLQLGNCGSPLETPEGWIVLTHGVGPVREYAIGAILLDLDDPSRIIGRLRHPLLRPTPEEREGYVPNVVYTCGSMIHDGRLILPYAMSDSCTAFATAPVDSLLKALKNSGP